ncbi:MAG: hypothetical protein DRQ88_05575 [Epsilonproteobacteria bacterium]|nr:MAG: hypothetical protein DRQ89_09740 [Campylobacterota bacterium]RLA66786.1 MAG: hypothetical protein DRQ88_05575 [Campylobacterota bacterium]
MVDDLPRGELYQAVKGLTDLNEVPHLHLTQHKLFTLTSVALQYLMYYSGQNPGSYILRIEDSLLYEKLVKKSKDPTTRNFLRALFLPRKIKYKNSLFFLDYFHMGTWQKTNEIPKDRIKGALIIKNSHTRPMVETGYVESEDEGQMPNIFPQDFYYTSLQDMVPKTIILAYGEDFEGTQKVEFPWIKKEDQKINGMTFSKDLGREIFK